MQKIRPIIFDDKCLIKVFRKSLLATRGYLEKTTLKLLDIQKFYIAQVLHILCKHTNMTLPRMFNISYKINKSCHKKVLSLDDANNYESNYHTIMLKIIMNLDPESSINNNYLINIIKDKTIDIDQICFCDSSILCPSKNFEIYQKVKDRNNIITEKKVTTLYTCGKCKQKKCTIQSVQLRSADEGCNLRIECTNCNNCWVI
jgi:transcription elongation factor S-II